MHFTLEELEDLRLIYKTFCTKVYSRDEREPRELTDLEKSIINKLERLIDYRQEECSMWNIPTTISVKIGN
jgi:hypothetical protein